MAFIDANPDELGVEPICTVLQVAPSTYAAKARRPSARAVHDAVIVPRLRDLWHDNYRVYGARKLWKCARRAGLDVGRDQVARLMRAAGIEGARRTERVRTTNADPVAARHPDLVNRDFTATAPNQVRVTDLTSVLTWTRFGLDDAAAEVFTDQTATAWLISRQSRGYSPPRPHSCRHSSTPTAPEVE